MRILVIGSNPSTSSPDNSAFHPDTTSGKIVRRWLKDSGCDDHLVIFMNMSNQKTPDNKPLRIKDLDLDELKTRIESKRPDIILGCGKTVSGALNKIGIAFIGLPHPSGLNRQLNDPNVEKNIIAQLQASLLPFPSSASSFQLQELSLAPS